MSDTNMVVTLDEVINYLGMDYPDDMAKCNINRAIKTADAYLKGSIGEGYPIDDPRAKELALFIISDLYDNRGLHDMSKYTRKLADDISLQIRLEMRRRSTE